MQSKERGDFLRAQIGRGWRQVVSEPRPEKCIENFESETALRGEQLVFKVFFGTHFTNLELRSFARKERNDFERGYGRDPNR
jgi:hypothetical protein